MNPIHLNDVTNLLHQEAHYLDTQQWDPWLNLFLEEAEYWVPAWKSEHETTSNPKAELSLIYYATRAGLEDRVWRVRSGRSVASKPLPRTQHNVNNVMLVSEQATDRVQEGVEVGVKVLCNWTVHQFRTKPQEVEVLFGRCEYDIVQHDTGLRIQRKKVILLNDYLPAMLDFYSL
jgi:3-phenylpropionate/cinnamic acid dioxygenase small subunit